MANDSGFIHWLEERHAAIMACEAQALQSLQNSDKAAYEQKMREKAQMLADLDRDSRQHMHDLSDDCKHMATRTLGSFSASATTALRLNSPFYMSALLYPDLHKPGEPDNLELFIRQMRDSCRQ